MNTIGTETLNLINTIKNSIEDIKGQDVKILDLRDLNTASTSFYIICSANSNTQVKAIAENIVTNSEKELKISPTHKEGLQQSEWVLLDYFNIVVHILQTNKRTYYDIESLWADAKEII